MLHIVQVVMWGVAETPQLFVDEEKARAAYVDCASKHWEQRYAAYCDHHGTSRESFLSAQAFVRTIDVSEKSLINFWTFNPDQIGLDCRGKDGLDREDLRQLREGVVAVREGLTGLLDRVSNLAETFAGLDGPPAQEDSAPTAAQQEKLEQDREKYRSKDWMAFVASLKRLGSGSKNEFVLLPRDDWRQQVYSNLTTLEYWDWVAETVATCKQEASVSGYSVTEDSGHPGYFKFWKDEKSSSESYCSEWEAWCAAGLHHRHN